jgi:predicted ATP-dependent serine protease
VLDLLSGEKSMDLLEREAYLADLAKWLGNAVQYGGCIALVSGEAGIGKTALLRQFSKQQDAVRVLWGACDARIWHDACARPAAPARSL